MPGYRLSDNRQVVQRVALAIARVIARKSVAEDARMQALDGLSRITATEELAQGIVAGIGEEASAAIGAVEAYLAELARKGRDSLTADSLASTAQSAFEDACGDDPSPYEVGMAWRAAGRSLFELLIETAEELEAAP